MSRKCPAPRSTLTVLTLAACAPAHAGSPASLAPSSTVAPQDTASAPTIVEPGARITLSIAPYAWLTSFSGEATLRGIEFDVDVSFADVVEEADTIVALMGAVDVSYDRFVFQFNGAWSAVEVAQSAGRFPAGTVNGELDLALGWFELIGGYRFLDRAASSEQDPSRRLAIDGYLGARLTTVDLDAKLTTDFDVTLPDGDVLMAGQTRERSASEEWIEPLVGARLRYDITNHWSLALRADIGGFGVSGADLAWQTSALVAYRWHFDGWSVAALGGYRALGQDYSSGDFGWDVIAHGPLLGAQFSFAF